MNLSSSDLISNIPNTNLDPNLYRLLLDYQQYVDIFNKGNRFDLDTIRMDQLAHKLVLAGAAKEGAYLDRISTYIKKWQIDNLNKGVIPSQSSTGPSPFSPAASAPPVPTPDSSKSKPSSLAANGVLKVALLTSPIWITGLILHFKK